MANDRDDQRKARELLAAEYDRDGIPFVANCIRTEPNLTGFEKRAIRAVVAALAQRAPQNGAMPEGMLDLVEALDAAMVESLMGEGADIWKGNRGKLRNRLPENVGAILAKMRALLAAAPAPEASKCGPACARCGSTTGAACSDHGCHYLTAGNGAPEAERAKGEAAAQSVDAYLRIDPAGIEPTIAVMPGDRERWADIGYELHPLGVIKPTAPSPAGQPEGVEAGLLELIANRVEVMADKYDSDGMRAIAADARRLASAQRAAGSAQQGDKL